MVLQEIWPEKETVKICASTVHKIKRTQTCKMLLLTDIVVQEEQKRTIGLKKKADCSHHSKKEIIMWCT